MVINKNKREQITRHRGKSRRVHVSSIVNEVIRGNLKPLYFFLREDFTRTKSKKYIQANKNKNHRIIIRIKTSKRKKVACLMFRKKGFKLPLITSFAIPITSLFPSLAF